MTSKALTDALIAIKANTVNTEEIQSKVTYSELIPYLFNTYSPQVQVQKNSLSERRRETGKRFELNEDEFLRIKQTEEFVEIKGVNASPGVAKGKIAYTHKTVHEYQKKEINVVYLMPHQTPDDVQFVIGSCAVITSEGGNTSHAAVTGRHFGIPTVTGCNSIKFDNDMVFVEQHVIKEGDDVIVDGFTGSVYLLKNVQVKENLFVLKPENDEIASLVSDFVYKSIQSKEIYSYGFDLACLVMMLKIRNAESLFEISNFSIDFEYLETIKQDSVLWKYLLPQLKVMCSKTMDIVEENTVKNEFSKTLSRINDMAGKSIDYRHHMMLLAAALKHIDNLMYIYKSGEDKNRKVKSPKILLVEDEPYLIADTIHRLKDELNADVTIISNAQDAIEVVRSKPILDLAIIDLMIPDGKDKSLDADPYKGIRVSEVLKEINGDKFPIMFLTSVRDVNIFEKLLNSTINRIINKPSLTSSIVDTVKDMLGNTNMADESLLQTEIQRRKLELESSSPDTRIRALWALCQYTNHDAEIVPLIQKIAGKDSSKKVKNAAKRILAQPFLLKDENFDYNKEGKATENRSVIIKGNVQNSIIVLGDENSIKTNK